MVNRLQLYISCLCIALASGISVHAQLTISPTATASVLANKLAGPGITIVSDTLICNNGSNGTFVSVTTPIGLDSGILLCTGRASDATGAEAPRTSTNMGNGGDNDLTSLLGTTTSSYDGCALIIHFVPGGDTVSFNYQFGSEEYISSVCGRYNDAFAFFISGPGISTTLPGVNMALVPGTNIPVTVNSINNGTPSSGYTLANCTAMGTGSPFTSYYIDNTAGSSIAYRGYTRVLTAKHWVIPCDTYRIKMAIVDAGNALYDSGVFIEAGSLKTNSFFFDATATAHTINGVNNAIVKGCGADSVYVKSNRRVSAATTIKFAYAGTAASGTDFVSYDSVTINAGDSSAAFPITGLITSTTGTTSATIYITSFTVCGTRYSGVSDSIVITLFDHPSLNITSNDTVVCTGQTITINTVGSAGLTYSWSPTTALSSAVIPNPTTTVTSPITYTVTGTLPGTSCAPITDTIKVSSVTPFVNILSLDTTVCEGFKYQFNVLGDDTMYYAWSPVTGLSSASAKQPLLTATTSNNYVLTVTIPHTSCAVTDNINVTVVPKFTVATRDTFICEGNNLYLNADVQPAGGAYAYAWTGPNGYTSGLLNPVITTSTQSNKGTYHLIVTNMGLCPMLANEYIDVLPTPKATIIAPEISYCQYAPSSPVMIPGYSNVMWYDSRRDTIPTLFAPYPNTDSIGVQIYYAAQISLVSNCLSEMQEVEVKVKPCCTGTIFVPNAFTPNFDGKNDLLRVVKSAEYAVNEFVIYNRWGVPVFEATGDKQAWDGTFNGDPADIGTYFYTLTANCVNADKKQISLKGDITLVR